MTIEEIEQSLKTIAEGQAGHEARLEWLEDAFRKVATAIEQLTQLATVTDERIDAGDLARERTDARLDALIDAQIRFDEGLAQLAAIQATHRRQAEERGAQLDAKLAQLAEGQARTDEQIRQLLSKNG